ncbi:hypothetical protein O59_000180 [Cellvibrio sp. BR]|nr:hypothetical protein O59_000180 [Cellvibrio sp. BR]
MQNVINSKATPGNLSGFFASIKLQHQGMCRGEQKKTIYDPYRRVADNNGGYLFF